MNIICEDIVCFSFSPEVTKDNNNGSFSDSSFDIDIEEPMEQRRDISSPSNAHSNNIAHHQSTSTNFTQNSGPISRKIDRQRVNSGSSSSRRGQSLAEGFSDSYNQVDVGTKRADSNRVSSRHLNNDIRGKTANSKTRIFIALFNYDPATMSPNPDGIDEELPFKEGQLIKVNSFQSYLTLYCYNCAIISTRSGQLANFK